MNVCDVILRLFLAILHIQPSLQVTLASRPCTSGSTCRQTDANAICNNVSENQNGFCKCGDNYKDDPTATSCVQRVLNRPCVEHNDCLQDGKFVECNDNDVCACKPGYADFDGHDICGKGLACLSDSGCTQYLANTTCFLIYGVFNCSCQRTHMEDDHVCKIKLDGTCSSDDDCIKLAECGRGTCRCRDGHERSGEYCTAGSHRLRPSLPTCGWLLALLTVLKYGTWM